MSQERMKKWAAVGIATLILITLATTLHNAGWSQGFAMGLLASNADSAQIAPYLAYRGGHGFGMGGFFGMMFRFGFFLLFLALIAKIFGFWRWRMHSHMHAQGRPFWEHRGSHGHHSAEQQPDDQKPRQTNWTNV